jgi:4-diphosphocytidyl-2-C-methyl-D-erythritol kinase
VSGEAPGSPAGDGPAVVEVAAPAKVNLALLVGPVRSDAYHEIFSLMVPITLGDHVTVRRTPGSGLSVLCDVSPGDDNLAARMVREVERRLDRAFEVEVTIVKRTPAAAGLGGGSSDAAAVLIALDRLFDLRLAPRAKYEAAAVVGADVPFFLWTGPQLAMGRGTVLREVELPQPIHIVVAVPDLALPTRDVYGWLDVDGPVGDAGFADRTQLLVSRVRGLQRPRDLAALVANDLEAPVVARHPEIGALRQRLLDAGAYAAAMSGSGSAVFGLFPDGARAQRALRATAPARSFYVTDLQPLQ